MWIVVDLIIGLIGMRVTAAAICLWIDFSIGANRARPLNIVFGGLSMKWIHAQSKTLIYDK